MLEKTNTGVLKDLIDKWIAKIGDYTYWLPTVLKFDDSDRLEIWKFCSIANGVTIILGGEHRHDWITTYPLEYEFNELMVGDYRASKWPVIIWNDVWIGQGATIMSGVKIGDGAVIGAHAVISKDVPDYAIMVGNPSHIAKFRHSVEDIKTLQEVKWWNWPISKIKDNINLLSSNKIQEVWKLT